jgi:hypothetical protein
LKSCAGVILTQPEPNSALDEMVGDDRDQPVGERQAHLLADQMP